MDRASGFKNEVNEEPKSCILMFGQQGPPEMVAETLKMTGCQSEHQIHIFTNEYTIFGLFFG